MAQKTTDFDWNEGELEEFYTSLFKEGQAPPLGSKPEASLKAVKKHYPGGQQHDQKNHGRRKTSGMTRDLGEAHVPSEKFGAGGVIAPGETSAEYFTEPQYDHNRYFKDMGYDGLIDAIRNDGYITVRKRVDEKMQGPVTSWVIRAPNVPTSLERIAEWARSMPDPDAKVDLYLIGEPGQFSKRVNNHTLRDFMEGHADVTQGAVFRSINAIPGPKMEKHYGPGPHPSGSPQSAHGGRAGISEVEAEGLASRLSRKGGFTYHPIDDRSPKKGFAVSIFPKDEHVIQDGGRPQDDVADDIYDYLLRKRKRFSDAEVFVGGWHDVEAGKIYLDLSVVKATQEEATKLAKEHGQEGIFNLKNGKTIIVKEEHERRKSDADVIRLALSQPVGSDDSDLRELADTLAAAFADGGSVKKRYCWRTGRHEIH